MTQKTLSNVTIGDRLISLGNQVLLHVVSSHEGNPVLIEDQGEGESGQVFETIGVVIPLDKLAEDGFLKIFEIAPYVNDAIVALVDGKWVTGSVIIVSDHLVTFAPTTSLSARPVDGTKAQLVNRKDVHVIYPAPRDDVPVLVADNVVVVINPLNRRFGEVCGVVADPFQGHVAVEFFDGQIVPLRTFEVARYTREAQISVLSADVLRKNDDIADALKDAFPVPPITTIIEDMKKLGGLDLFQADFVPANVTLPQADGEDYNPVGDCFSVAELELIVGELSEDDEAASNLLGMAIVAGRQIDEAVLRTLLAQSIPYGFSQFIPDATAFFKLVGEIANEQTTKKLKALLSGDMVGATEELAAPSDIAFARITGFDQDQSEAIMDSELDADDVQDLTDAYAQRAAEGYRSEPAPLTPFGQSLETLNQVFGEGNFKLLSAEEAAAIFGEEAAISAIAEGGVFGEVLRGPAFDALFSQIIGDSDAALSDALSDDAGINLGELLAQIAGTPAKPVPAPDVFEQAHIDLDECLSEFSTLAQAGRSDSHLVHASLTENIGMLDTSIGDALSDIAKGQKLIESGLASLRQANEFRRILSPQANNILPLADAFDALVTDVTNLQSARGTL